MLAANRQNEPAEDEDIHLILMNGDIIALDVNAAESNQMEIVSVSKLAFVVLSTVTQKWLTLLI